MTNVVRLEQLVTLAARKYQIAKLNRNKMKIISLYPYDDVYQVVSEDESTVYFQGTKEECEKFKS